MEKPSETNDATIRIAIPDPYNSGQMYLTLPNKKSVIVSIKVLSSNCSPKEKFVSINWKGGKVSEYKELDNLTVKLLGKDKALTLIN